MDNKERITSLQALRALACIGIFLGHAGIFGQLGGVCVSIFFVMSGFLLTHTYIHTYMDLSVKERIKFALKKLRRLYPLHIITMIATIVFLIIHVYRTGGNIFAYIFNVKLAFEVIINVFLIQSWVPSYSYNVCLNGVAWFLSDMVFIYFMFPIILKIIRKIDNKYKLILFSLIIWILQYTVSLLAINIYDTNAKFYAWATYACPLYRLGDFIIGCNMGYIFINTKKKEWSALQATILEIIVIISSVVVMNWKWKQTDYIAIFLRAISKNSTFIFVPFAVMYVIMFAYCRGAVTRLLNNKLLVYLGDISSYIFLIHYVITTNVLRYTSNYAHMSGIIKIGTILFEFVLAVLLSSLYRKYQRHHIN